MPPHLLKTLGDSRMERDENYKSRLLEFAQGRGMGTPRYVTIDEAGPDHNPIFTVEVQVAGVPAGKGKGGNKKTAEQNAASRALVYLQEQDQSVES